MRGNVDPSASKRVCTEERANVSENQFGSQVAKAFDADWSGLLDDAIATIGPLINKQVVMSLRCINKENH